MTAYYDNQPSILEAMGDGSYRYRWAITKADFVGEEDETIEQWQCQEVTVWAALTPNKITRAVIDELWGEGVEQKMLNEYNAANLGLYDASVAEAKVRAYTEFLRERERIKAMVDADCQSLNII